MRPVYLYSVHSTAQHGPAKAGQLCAVQDVGQLLVRLWHAHPSASNLTAQVHILIDVLGSLFV